MNNFDENYSKIRIVVLIIFFSIKYKVGWVAYNMTALFLPILK